MRHAPLPLLTMLAALAAWLSSCATFPHELEVGYAQGELGNGFPREDERDHHLVSLALVWHLRPAPVYLTRATPHALTPELGGLPAPSSPLPPPGGDSLPAVEETPPRGANSTTAGTSPGAPPGARAPASRPSVDDSTTGASDLVHQPAASWGALALEMAGDHQLEGLIGLISLAIAAEILRRLGVIRVPGLPDRRPGRNGNGPTHQPPPG